MKYYLHIIFKKLADKTDVKHPYTKPGLVQIPPLLLNRRLLNNTFSELIDVFSKDSVEEIQVKYIGYHSKILRESVIENPDRGIPVDNKNEE